MGRRRAVHRAAVSPLPLSVAARGNKRLIRISGENLEGIYGEGLKSTQVDAV